MAGKLIVIDGGDGAGKKTQVALLKSSLEAEGKDVKTLDFPRYGSFFGTLIGKYLHGDFGSLREVKPEMASLLYALDRFDEAKRLKEWLAEGNIVILDRYVESNLAYQSAKLDTSEREGFVSWVEELEYKKLGLPKADLVLYLHVPVEISAALLKDRPSKHGKEMDIHEQDKTFQKQVAKSYISLADKKGWHVVECAKDSVIRDKDDIASEIKKLVLELI